MSIVGNLGVVLGQNGKRFATGTVTPASADIQVVTGLANVDEAGVSFAAVPTITHTISVAEAGTNAADIRIRSFKPTDTTLTTPVAATTPWSLLQWWAIGD